MMDDLESPRPNDRLVGKLLAAGICLLICLVLLAVRVAAAGG